MNSSIKTFTITYRAVKRVALIYITFPLFCFFAGWLKWYFALAGIAALLVCLFFAESKNNKARNEDEKDNTEDIIIPKYLPFMIVTISFIYAFFCGIGRLWAQSKDYPWRNAIFRDIILRDWPVLYEKYKGALVYYIGLWLPPSIPGKIAYKLGAGPKVAFLVGNIALLIYVTAGLSILFFLLISYFKPRRNSLYFLIIGSFIFFSGMDIIASIEPLGANEFHLEWWAKDYQYSSFTTCMCWVFNQSLIPWICMILLLKEKNIKNYVFIGMCCLLCGPFPFVGYFVYSISIGIKKFVEYLKNKEIKTFIKQLFSVSNLIAALLVFPFIGLFFLSNAAITSAGGVGLSNADSLNKVSSGNTNDIFYACWVFIKFALLEFGVYAILIFAKNKKNYLYYLTIGQLLIYPFIRMGGGPDFTMRASIPAILMMYLFCWDYIYNYYSEYKELCEISKSRKIQDKQKNSLSYKQTVFKYGFVLLIICLILGAATPSVEFIRGFRQVILRGIDDPVTDSIYTFGGDSMYGNQMENGSSFYNFIALDLDNHVFFKYFSK